jgi:hypothetical protein
MHTTDSPLKLIIDLLRQSTQLFELVEDARRISPVCGELVNVTLTVLKFCARSISIPGDNVQKSCTESCISDSNDQGIVNFLLSVKQSLSYCSHVVSNAKLKMENYFGDYNEAIIERELRVLIIYTSELMICPSMKEFNKIIGLKSYYLKYRDAVWKQIMDKGMNLFESSLK